MFVVDTNIFLYAVNAAAPEHRRSAAFVEWCRGQVGVWFTTWGVVYEFLRVSTHPRVFERPLSASQAWGYLDALIESSHLELLAPGPRHAEVLREVVGEVPGIAGNLLHNVATAAIMREHGVRRIYTRDVDFHRLPFIEPVDPLR